MRLIKSCSVHVSGPMNPTIMYNYKCTHKKIKRNTKQTMVELSTVRANREHLDVNMELKSYVAIQNYELESTAEKTL